MSVDVDRLADLEPTSARALAEAEALVARGDLLDAIDLLQRWSYDERDPLVDVRLAELRRDAFPIVHNAPPGPWPPEFADPFPGETNLIDLPRSEVTPEIVGGAIRHHGCILVRGLIEPDVAAGLVESIERSFTALEAANEGATPDETSPWYKPLEPHPEFPPNIDNQIEERANLRWLRVCTLDSPRTMFEVIDAYERAGIGDIVRHYLRARPVLTGAKWALRRMPRRMIAGWHQEASVFPKVPIHTMNVWLALTPCGDDSPSLDVVPRREAEIHPVGKSFMMVPEDVDGITAGAPKVSPRYEPGDAMLFDEMLIHRTNTAATMDGVRYSIESWFFAPSGHPTEFGSIVY